MAKRTLEVYDCDKCGKPAQRYSITFEEGTLILDRCPDHNKRLEALRSEKGEWVSLNHMGRNVFRKSSLSEIRLAVLEGQRSDGDSPDDDE